MSDWVTGRYRIRSQLGAGAHSVVWLAYDSVLDRDVALKELRPGPGALGDALAEARAAARLSSPSIVTIHDVVRHDERVLIAMELLDGPTLGDVVRRTGPVAPDVAAEVLGRVAEALAVAHRAGVVHRDLKADNVFWLPNGRVVVCDFGIARLAGRHDPFGGTVAGTPGYLAPEQARGGPVGPAADVFSWGATASELLTGASPYGDTATTPGGVLLDRTRHEQPAIPRVPGAPRLEAVVAAALRVDPATRPPNGAVLVDALRGVPLPAPVPPRAPEPAPRRRQPVSRMRVAGVLLFVLLVAGIVTLTAVYADGGLGEEVRVEPLGAPGGGAPAGAAPVAEDPVAGTTFVRVVGTACADVRAEQSAASRSLTCATPGSLLAGDGQVADAEGTTWLRVLEPQTDTWGWVPRTAVEDA